MARRAVILALLLVAPMGAAVAVAPVAHATPVCAGAASLAPPPCPRVFPEPLQSTNWTQFGPDSLGRSEYADGMHALQAMYPRYIRFDTLAHILHDPRMVSVGTDGRVPWDPKDAGDGLPLDVAEVTDFSVPDTDKAYVVILFVHSAEPCGREAGVRLPEDLVLMAQSGRSLDNGVGLDGKPPTSIPVAELLKREHIFILGVSPDGWRSGDLDTANAVNQATSNRPPSQSQTVPVTNSQIRLSYSEENGRGVNTNRQMPTTGWLFRQPPASVSTAPGQNPILTEPEGIASYRYLTQLKATHGHIDGVMDVHGPLPLPADIMLPDGQFDPQKEYLLADMAARVKHNMDASVGQHLQDPALVDQLRPFLSQFNLPYPLGADWTQVGQVWDTINYTVTGAYGFWMAQAGGLGGVGTNYENNCVATTGIEGAVTTAAEWNPVLDQFFVDSARAAMDTTLVQSLVQSSERAKVDPKGRVGYVFNPAVLTEADNPSPPPAGFPGNPYFGAFTQVPYRATSMQFLEDYSKYAAKPFIPLNPSDVAAGKDLDALDTLVVVNHDLPADATGAAVDSKAYFARLRAFVENGGNLVLTDGAERALADMGVLPRSAIEAGIGYVGYVDIQDHGDPLVAGLPPKARETYDPVTIGYQLRIERDIHWAGNAESGTANMAPIWMLDRAAFEAAGGKMVATADPINDPKTTADEGSATNKVAVGTLPLGKGRVVVIGALLPDPTDRFPHWFGLGSYGVTQTGHHIFQQAITWTAKNRAPLTGDATQVEAATSAGSTPNTPASSAGALAGIPAALLMTGLVLVPRRRRARRGVRE